MPESSPLTTDRILSSRYRLVAPLARGGMAEVWEGHDEVLARAVAVKVLHPHLAADPDFAERFRREAIAAARLSHPNIVATFDAGTDDDTAYIVMELVRGRTLRDALEDGPLPPPAAAHIAHDVADALDCAHRHGLVHRDVKPGNILLADTADGSLQVKVTDFGIAKLEAEANDLTQTGAVIGTAKYLSPEQVEGRSPDARSDVYALGVVLYELLCGQAPFQGETELATALQHVQADPLPPRRLQAGIPKPLETVVMRAMAKEPEARYRSAAEMRDALAAIDLADDDAVPDVTRDPTPASGVAPLPRRARRAAAPLIVLAAVALAAVVIAATLTRSPTSHSSQTRANTPAAGQTLRIASDSAFDPFGDGHENDAEAANAIDGNPATSWHSDHYNGANFGNLKPGLGLVFALASPAAVGQLKVISPVRGWSATVYVSSQSGASLAAWGQPVDAKASIPGDATFDLHGRRGAFVLLWITDPGPDAKAEIADATVTGS